MRNLHYCSKKKVSMTDTETKLDNVSGGLTEWKGLLRIIGQFSKYCERACVHIHQVEKMLGKTFGDFLFASLRDQSRTYPSCQEGSLDQG
ncbi:DNA topoisomerase I, bacterial-type [Artemisia annua]|uniref:DNA topoisomerase I, bacterial-type n=1 Tax=Artemisia annua TaxID=35608 RepID=A0A2U1M2V9_ARTAN|nr:DNA topoisomerase I, bacterial-type [Artemisia annua]